MFSLGKLLSDAALRRFLPSVSLHDQISFLLFHLAVECLLEQLLGAFLHRPIHRVTMSETKHGVVDVFQTFPQKFFVLLLLLFFT